MCPSTICVAGWADLDPLTLHDILRLRVDVFVVEQACPYPEIDGRDVEPATEHVWLRNDRRVAAYLRVLVEPDGARRVGRVVTHRDARRSGLAARLLADVVTRHGQGPLVLDAQSYLAPFYERFGFTAMGPEFLEDGIPHIPMRREARPSGQGSDATSSPSSTFGPV
ncbi:MAG: GNAT family N-acetyltransferase [Actinomycetes bacterium]